MKITYKIFRLIFFMYIFIFQIRGASRWARLGGGECHTDRVCVILWSDCAAKKPWKQNDVGDATRRSNHQKRQLNRQSMHIGHSVELVEVLPMHIYMYAAPECSVVLYFIR